MVSRLKALFYKGAFSLDGKDLFKVIAWLVLPQKKSTIFLFKV